MTNYPIGAILGAQYRLEQEVGHGAMGRVFLARDLKHGRAVAVKMLHGDLTTSISIERFTREIQVISRLNHPHIVGLYDSGEFDGQLYYVMPLVEGDTLRDRLRREKRLPAEDAVRITLQICDALAYAHSHGIVHRDIKPDNILLPTRNHAVLADFGLSRALMTATDRRLTATGFSLGTPRYMSPEQTAGDREVDGRSDIYSLGTVLYEMLSGEPPFVDEDVRRLLARKLSEPPPELKARRPDVPVAVAGVVRTALATIPAERFKAADGFA